MRITAQTRVRAFMAAGNDKPAILSPRQPTNRITSRGRNGLSGASKILLPIRPVDPSRFSTIV
jgi:hypothetical protein